MKPLIRCGWKPPPVARSSIVPRIYPQTQRISLISNVHSNTSRLFILKPLQLHQIRNASNTNNFIHSPLLEKEKNPDQAKFLQEFVRHLQDEKMDEANSMFDAMIKHEEHFDLMSTELTEAYLAKLTKQKMFARAFKLYDIAKEAKVKFGPGLALSFCEMALKAKDLDRAYGFLEEYFNSQRAAKMDESIIIVFVKTFARSKNWKDITDFFEYITSCEKDAKKLGRLQRYYMNALLKEIGVKKGDLEAMEKLLELYDSLGVEKNPLTYSTLMSAYALQRQPKKFLLQMAIMSKAGFKPTQTTFNLMVLMFACVGDTKKMEDYFLEMKANGLVRNVTYFTAVFGFLNNMEFEKAFDYLEEIRALPGYKPSPQLFYVMRGILEKLKKEELLERLNVIMQADQPKPKELKDEDLAIDEESFKQLITSVGPERFL